MQYNKRHGHIWKCYSIVLTWQQKPTSFFFSFSISPSFFIVDWIGFYLVPLMVFFPFQYEEMKQQTIGRPCSRASNISSNKLLWGPWMFCTRWPDFIVVLRIGTSASAEDPATVAMDCPIIQIPVVFHGRQRNIKRALAKVKKSFDILSRPQSAWNVCHSMNLAPEFQRFTLQRIVVRNSSVRKRRRRKTQRPWWPPKECWKEADHGIPKENERTSERANARTQERKKKI